MGALSRRAAQPARPTHRIQAFFVEQLERRVMLAATVVGRHVFYNNSAFDGRNVAANAADDAAIATDKRVLLPGETATFANYTDYSRGINGLMVDIRGLPEGKGPLFNFQFLYADTGEWDPAPDPRSITTRRGAGVGGSDRVTITWNDGVIRNRWLQVIVYPGSGTGLAARDDFYVGNRVAETGDDPAAAMVTAADVIATRANISRAASGVGNKYDHNRDGKVNVADVEIARRNRTNRRIELLSVAATPVPRMSQVRLANDTGDDDADGITYDARVRGRVSDEEYLAEFRAGFDGAPAGTWVDVRSAVSEGDFWLDAAVLEAIHGGPLAQGAHALHLRTVDPRGNSNTIDLSFSYDSVVPVLTLDPPPHGLVTGNVVLTGRATDVGGAAPGVGVSRDEDGGFSPAGMNGDQFTYNAGFNPDGSDDGQHTLRVRAVDLAGNESATAEVTFFVLTRALGALPGPGTDPANAGLPLLPVPDAPAGDFTRDNRPQGTGLATSRTRLVVHFAAAATKAQANAVIASLGAVVVGTVPDAEAVVIAIPDTADLEAMDAALASLLANPAVALVTPDVALGFTSLPTPTGLANQSLAFPWSWELPRNPVPFDGNWGLEAIRAPQMWSLNTLAARANAAIRTGVLDAGFNDTDDDGFNNHPDLASLRTWHFPVAPGPAVAGLDGSTHFHGEHVAGIIGAGFHDNTGITGVNPFVEAHTPADNHFIGVPDTHGWATHLSDLAMMLNAWPNLRVVNISLGSNWYQGTPPVDANTSAVAHQTEQLEGLFVRKIAANHPNTLIFAAAGNDSGGAVFPKEIDARWTSPFDWAAKGPSVVLNGQSWGQSTNIIVVEAVAPSPRTMPGALFSYAKADFSNVGGDVSAPGQDILSTVGSNMQILDNFGRPTGALHADYESHSGTSMATPHVTGLVGYLMNLNPALTPMQVRNLLLDTQFTRDAHLLPGDQNRLPAGVTNPAPMVDAFAAALGLDVLLEDANKTVQRGLVDVDDGTRDGNLRVDPVTRSAHDTIDTSDRRRGDGRITMRDFRAWRDAYLQTHPNVFSGALTTTLDGPAHHFKRDLNFDGTVGPIDVSPRHPVDIPSLTHSAYGPDENIYPRYDFNGDGRIGEWWDTAPFKIDPDTPRLDSTNLSTDIAAVPGFLRDLDVLADSSVWTHVERDGYSENVTTDPALAGTPVGEEGTWGAWSYLLANRDANLTAVPNAMRLRPDYLHSFDAHVNIDWSQIDPAFESVYVRVSSEIHGSDIEDGWRRSVLLERGRGTTVMTVPVWTGAVRFEVAGVDEDDPSPPNDLNDLPLHAIDWHDVTIGEDRALKLPVYRLVDLGRLGQGNVSDGDYWSEAIAVNNNGQVVGNSSTSFLDRNGFSIEHAFFWEDLNGNGASDPGEMIDMVPGGSGFSGDATDINDRGEAAGRWYSETINHSEIYVRGDDGALQGIGVNASLGGMNDSGVIVGTIVSGGAVRAFRRGPGGMEIFGTLGGANSRAEGINSLGHVVGSADNGVRPRAFVSREDTTLTELVSPLDPFNGLPNTNPSFALDINDTGWIAGYYFSPWGNRTIAWDPNGVAWDVGGTADEATYPRAINNSATIVGYADPHPNGLRNHAFMVRAGGGPIDLNTLLPPNSGWSLREANDINDRGEIVGMGVFNDEFRAFLLTTVPAPAGRSAAPAPSAAPPEPPASAPRIGQPPRRGGYSNDATVTHSAVDGSRPPIAAAADQVEGVATDLLRN